MIRTTEPFGSMRKTSSTADLKRIRYGNISGTTFLSRSASFPGTFCGRWRLICEWQRRSILTRNNAHKGGLRKQHANETGSGWGRSASDRRGGSIVRSGWSLARYDVSLWKAVASLRMFQRITPHGRGSLPCQIANAQEFRRPAGASFTPQRPGRDRQGNWLRTGWGIGIRASDAAARNCRRFRCTGTRSGGRLPAWQTGRGWSTRI